MSKRISLYHKSQINNSSQNSKNLINSFVGFKIQIYLFISSIIISLCYSYLDHRKITQPFILFMLQFFCIIADFGIFLTIAYFVQFKRGMLLVYFLKIITFLSIDKNEILQMQDFIKKIILIPFGLVLYYKITLFLIIMILGYITQIEYQKYIEKQQQGEAKYKLKQNNQQNKNKQLEEQTILLVIKNQIQQQKIKNQQNSQNSQYINNNNKSQSIKKKLKQYVNKKVQIQQKSINQKISSSLLYYKQQQLYKKVQVFYFIIFFSTCLLVLFPIQDYIIDYTKILNLNHNNDQNKEYELLTNLNFINKINNQITNYINYHSIINVVAFWVIFLIGEFKIKNKYPELIKDYILTMPNKFIIIQFLSFIIISIMIFTLDLNKHTQQLNNNNKLQPFNNIRLYNFINIQIFLTAFLIHTLIPIFISFLFFRIYLGYIYNLNKLVSKMYSFHNNYDDSQSNLDQLIYQFITQNDINKVKYFQINQKDLISRHKLKRYTQEEKLKQYVNQQQILQIQSLFQDYLVLDLYNKFSRTLSVIMFYITLFIFLLSLNVNDKYIINYDNFFPHKPVILLLVGVYFMNKYQSTTNIFYPKIINKLYNKISQFLAARKSYNFIKLIHFYSIIFGIWLYRIISEILLPKHQQILLNLKNTLYDFYSNQSYIKNQIISNLFQGYSNYFITTSQSCQYGLNYLIIDTIIIVLTLAQILCTRYFYHQYKGKWDFLLILLKILTPFYMFYVFIWNLQCLNWENTIFSVCICLGVSFMHNNNAQLKRGIEREQEQRKGY